ncbi:MAG: hypothetical protein OWU33_06020 [Firmicutes bacterium]|nr:hypothetical protein [Bacillota bacterium]
MMAPVVYHTSPGGGIWIVVATSIMVVVAAIMLTVARADAAVPQRPKMKSRMRRTPQPAHAIVPFPRWPKRLWYHRRRALQHRVTSRRGSQRATRMAPLHRKWN